VGTLADNIKDAIRDERYVFGVHANLRLRQRQIMGWQVVSGIDGARVLDERPDSEPNAVVEFEQFLADGDDGEGRLGADCRIANC
jgi:hypothetical protein